MHPAATASPAAPVRGTSRAYVLELEDGGVNKQVTLDTTSIVDQAAILAPPPDPDPEPAATGDEQDDVNDINAGDSCPQGSKFIVMLNAEDEPIDNWCNNPSKTYWMKAR